LVIRREQGIVIRREQAQVSVLEADHSPRLVGWWIVIHRERDTSGAFRLLGADHSPRPAVRWRIVIRREQGTGDPSWARDW